MFGARVYAKQSSGHRPTKLDPHFYDGRFLRFAATSKNMVYYDTNTQREKTARHCTLDEFYFNTTKPRPPGAQQLVDTTMPNWDETLIHNLSSDGIISILPISQATFSIDAFHPHLEPEPTMHATYTAAAATLFATITTMDEHLEELLHTYQSTDMYTIPIRVTLEMNRLPTLGLIFQQESERLRLMDCQEAQEIHSKNPQTKRSISLWQAAEWVQHDKYKQQGMFGTPVSPPPGATILPFVWAYSFKPGPLDPTKINRKARGACNGGPNWGKAVTLAETYATCVDQSACRLFWSLVASSDLVAMGADAGNAFADAPPAVDTFYMRIEEQFLDWWTFSEKQPVIPRYYVLSVCQAVQGHPEASRLWEKHIHSIIVNHLQFQPTTHQKCLYSKRSIKGGLQLLLQQVDAFAWQQAVFTNAHKQYRTLGNI